ncbi:SLC13 family permease [candidate division KSB1 bacterium]|nr:SLC13 family permease [candidate division KSB1 bacterium]
MTTEIILVLAVLAVTILLFILEIFRVDLIAILIMISLAWLGLVPAREVFSGFASNAVISMIAVMILGYGIDRSGAMNQVTRYITQIAGASEKRLIAVVAAAVGILSAFMQNIGAAVLFLPSLLMISRSNRISPSRLMMPLGFAAILGGTMSMVGSGPLIILNDLLAQGGQTKYGLFSVTPLGLLLLAAGIGYFLLLGKYVLPSENIEKRKTSVQQQLIETWHLPSAVHHCRIPADSPMINKTREEIQFRSRYKLNLLALKEGDDILYAPWRYTRFVAGQILIFLGEKEDIERLASEQKLQFPIKLKLHERLAFSRGSGFAEVIIPPLSKFVGKSIREITLRKTFGVEPILLYRGAQEERGDFSDRALQPGDDLIIHGPWENLNAMAKEQACVLVTPIEAEPSRASRPLAAMLCFLGAAALAIAGFHLSLALMSGALAMVLVRVISIDELYRAVEWRTVFLLAGLIPLGIAMDRSGTAAYIADHLMILLKGSHPLVLLTAVATLATLFSLFMSNVAATVLLVPLVMMMATIAGIDARALALLVAVCASNSFLLPTHQVNALLMSPGGYRNIDYLRAGGIMTIIFIIIVVLGIYLIYL